LDRIITIRDETPAGSSRSFTLILANPIVTIGELIEFRVRQEVDAHNKQQAESYSGLVQPASAEVILNAPGRGRSRKLIDADAQVRAAFDGFKSNAFVLLIDEKQMESLNETVDLSSEHEITFIKLVPLVGG
jgi:hypothetical protein